MLKLLQSAFADDFFRRIQHTWTNYNDIRKRTAKGLIFLEKELKWLLGCDDSWLKETANEYKNSFLAWFLLNRLESSSEAEDGYTQSLDTAEGFAAWTLVKYVPQYLLTHQALSAIFQIAKSEFLSSTKRGFRKRLAG